MRPEYDFSKAHEGARASRFSTSEPWYRQAVEADRARWLAEAMRHVQRLECELVTYFVFASAEGIVAAADRAMNLLEDRGEGMACFAIDLARDGAMSSALAERLGHLAAERSWLLHHSFLDESSSPGALAARLRTVAGEADTLAAEITALLRSRFIDTEVSVEEFERRAGAVRRSWRRAA